MWLVFIASGLICCDQFSCGDLFTDALDQIHLTLGVFFLVFSWQMWTTGREIEELRIPRARVL
jgi:hypothetical protein